MKTINKTELLKLLQKVDGNKATFVSVIYNTDARLKKKDNPYLGTRKINKISGLINFNYQNRVNNQRIKEGKEDNFQAETRKYGFKADDFNGCLLYGAGDTKLIISPEKSYSPKFVFNNKLVSKDKIQPWLPKVKETNNQNVDKQIVYMNIDLSNILKITIDKNTYRVRN